MRFSNTLRCDGLPERGVLLSRLMGGGYCIQLKVRGELNKTSRIIARAPPRTLFYVGDTPPRVAA